MRSQTHLFRRGAQYYWRRRIPGRVRPRFQRAQLVKGLSTTDPETARRRVRRLDAAADQLFDEAARMADKLTPEQIRRLTRDIIELELDELERQRAADPDLTPERAVMAARIQIPTVFERGLVSVMSRRTDRRHPVFGSTQALWASSDRHGQA